MKSFNYGPPFPNRGDTRGVHTNRDDRGYLEGFPFEVTSTTGQNIFIARVKQDIDGFVLALHQGSGNFELGVWPHEMDFPHSNIVSPRMKPWWIYNTDSDQGMIPVTVPRNTYTFTIANLAGVAGIIRGCFTVWRFGG